MNQLALAGEATLFDPFQWGAAAVVIIFAFFGLRLLAKIVEGFIGSNKASGSGGALNGSLTREERTALRRIVPVLESLDTHLYKSEELQRQLIEELQRNRDANERRLAAEEDNTKRWIDLYAKTEAFWQRMDMMLSRGIVCRYGDTVVGGD